MIPVNYILCHGWLIKLKQSLDKNSSLKQAYGKTLLYDWTTNFTENRKHNNNISQQNIATS